MDDSSPDGERSAGSAPVSATLSRPGGGGPVRVVRRRSDPLTPAGRAAPGRGHVESDFQERAHAAFVLSCMGLVFAAVFAIPVVFLRGGPAEAGREARAAEASQARGGSGPGGPAATPVTLSEEDLNAVREWEEAPAPPPPPPQTIADACRRLPGYGTLFVEPRDGEAGVRVIEGTFGRRSFYALVKAVSGDVGSVAGVVESVRRESLFDFRRIQPHHRYRLFVDARGGIRMFEYAPSETEMYHVVRTGALSFTAHAVEVPIEFRVALFAGRVDRSFARSLVDVGLDASIMPLITNAFSYAVDFSTAARPGDRFRLAVEERRIGGEFSKYTRVLAIDYVGSTTGEIHAYAFDVDGRTRYFGPDGSSLQREFLSAPCRYEAISSRFDPQRMHPILNRRMPHEGVDLVAPSGTPVYAIADGRVAFHGERGPNGELVVLEHSGTMLSYYAHLSEYARDLRDGMRVRKGQLVGYVGSTGRSTGPHLHFGIKVGGKFVDPEAYLRSRRGNPVPADRMDEFEARVAELSRSLERIAMPAGPPAPVPLPTPEVGLVPPATSVPAADAAP